MSQEKKQTRPILKLNLFGANQDITKKAKAQTTQKTNTRSSILSKEETRTESANQENQSVGSTKNTPKPPTRKYLIDPEKYQEILKNLQDLYPKCFTTPPSPLALKIHEPLYDDPQNDLTKTTIRRFLHIYCMHKPYRKSLKPGIDRLNLDGSVQSKVTEEQAAFKKNN